MVDLDFPLFPLNVGLLVFNEIKQRGNTEYRAINILVFMQMLLKLSTFC